jgi:hypothetical protein
VGRAAELEWSDDDQTILPAQFFRPPECGPYGYGPGSGPRRLMVAVLVDALRSVAEVARGPRTIAQQAKDQAWLLSDSTARMFSFRRICTVLELDPDAVRRGVRLRVVRTGKLRRVYAAHRTIGAIAAGNGHGRSVR